MRQLSVVLATLIALAVLMLLVLTVVRLLSPQDSLASAIAPNEYQAVFLTNGQVYFGSLSAPGGDFYYLRHVYYLASRGSLQSGRPAGVFLKAITTSAHAPQDLMIINRSQISFVENLDPAGKVARYLAQAGNG